MKEHLLHLRIKINKANSTDREVCAIYQFVDYGHSR